jgi:hypothetical protein
MSLFFLLRGDWLAARESKVGKEVGMTEGRNAMDVAWAVILDSLSSMHNRGTIWHRAIEWARFEARLIIVGNNTNATARLATDNNSVHPLSHAEARRVSHLPMDA